MSPRNGFNENGRPARSSGGVEVSYNDKQRPSGKGSKGSGGSNNGPVDIDALDDLFRSFKNHQNDNDDDSFFGSEEDYDSDAEMEDENKQLYFQNPNAAVLDRDAVNIPGSPWAKPATRKSNRPSEPLPIAKYTSGLAFMIAFGWVIFLVLMAIWNHDNIGRIIVEIFLAILSFFGLFWNSYFTVSSIAKCFIPAKAFKQNTKYFSMIPEQKQPGDEWLDVTIQIPVYKESLQEVLMPTLKSCMKARDYYISHSQAHCNIVVCDDGIMAYLNDNFPAAEMLWENVGAYLHCVALEYAIIFAS